MKEEKNNFVNHQVKCLLLSIILILASTISFSGLAQGEEAEVDFFVRPQTYAVLSDTQDMMSEHRYDDARTKLIKFLPRVVYQHYEKALVNQLIAHTFLLRDRDLEAINYFEQALNIDSLPNDLIVDLRYILAQLFFRNENFQSAIEILDDKVVSEHGPSLALSAQIFYSLERYSESLSRIQAAIEQGGETNENWLKLLLALHYKLQDYGEAKFVANLLIRRHPENKEYWQYLSNTALLLRQYSISLAALEIIQKQFGATPQEIRQMALLYLQNQNPYQAARMMEQAMENGTLTANEENVRLLSESWLISRELEKSLSIMTMDGASQSLGMQFRMSEILIQLERWEEAQLSLSTLLNQEDHEGEIDSGKAQLLLGIAAFYNSNFSLSRKSFEKLVEDKNYQQQAESWLLLSESRELEKIK